MTTDVLVPTDGSDRAERAFDHALEMAENDDGTLHLLHVVDTERYGEPALSSSELVVTQREDEGTQLLKRLGARAGRRGVAATMEQCHGDPVARITDCIDAQRVDTVVMDRQGFDQERSTGSVSTTVLRNTDAEIVLV